MRFNWKKKNRFSQLVADHLQSPKHGGSLVVQTGFPTSLIDLYVRNRSRFRKPSPSGLLIDSIASSSSCSSISLFDSNNSSSCCYDYKEDNVIIEDLNSNEIDVERSVKSAKLNSFSDYYDCKLNNEVIEEDVANSSEIEVERSVELAKLNPVFVVILKVLIMLVLVLGTKRFTFGITVSAFLLFLLEWVSKQLLRRSSLIDSNTSIESKVGEKNTGVVVCSEVMEIKEQVEPNEVISVKVLDEAKSEDLMEVRRKSSRRALMKSRMKKLVPKKLRRSSLNSKKENEKMKCVGDVIFSSQCSDSKGENLSVLKQEYDEIEETEKRSSSLTYLSEIYHNHDKLRIESRPNSGYLVLCLIVLVGLIGGRVLALSLALSWCLMLKTLQWKNCLIM